MLKKEIKDTIGELLIILLLIIGLSFLALIKGVEFYIIPLLELILLLYPVFSGWSIFSREKKENSFEYLFSLPIGKNSILINKLIPRIVSVLLVLVIYLPLREYFASDFFFDKNIFIILYLLLFILSFSFSLLFNNIAMVLASITFFGMFMILIDMKVWKLLWYSDIYILIIIVALSFPIVFIYSFIKDDILPIKLFNRKFLTRSIITFIIVLVGLTVFIKLSGMNNYNYYMLTKNGKIIISDVKSLKVVDAETGKTILSIDYKVFPIVYKDDLLYGETEEKDKSKLISINLKTKEIKNIHEAEKYSFFSNPHINDNGITFLVREGGDYKSILIINKDKIRKIDFPKGAISGGVFLFKLISESPLCFIYTKYNNKTYKYENGKTEHFFTGDIKFYKNRMVLCDKSSFKVYERGNSEPVFAKNEGGHIFLKWFERPYEKRFMVVKLTSGVYIFDFETLDLHKINLKFKKDNSVVTGSFVDKTIIAIWNNNTPYITVMVYKKGRLISKKGYKSSFKKDKYIYLSRKGMMVIKWMKKYEFIKF